MLPLLPQSQETTPGDKFESDIDVSDEEELDEFSQTSLAERDLSVSDYNSTIDLNNPLGTHKSQCIFIRIYYNCFNFVLLAKRQHISRRCIKKDLL